jgi:hypothetical protein
MTRAIDVTAGLLLFSCAVWVAYFYFVLYFALPSLFGSSPPWWAWTPIVLGCVAALAAIGLCLRRRLSGIVGSLSMLALTAWSFRTVMLGDRFYFDYFIMITAPLLVTGFLVYWRFVMTPRAKTCAT